MEQKKLIVIGCGSRGKGYSDKALNMDGKFKIVGIAEPIEEKRKYFKKKYGVPEDMIFESWEPLLALGKIADAAIISTMDRDHFAPAVAAMREGYDLLLEKPVCPTKEECIELYRIAKELDRRVIVCHVLRYTPFFNALKRIIDSGMIGKVMNVQHIEAVGNTHQSHSFVRGKWGNSERSSCMILQKSCHDMDILQWLVGKKCLSVQSFGDRTYFRDENAPEGAPEFCIEGCPEYDTCPYNAVKLYYEDKKNGWFRGAAANMHEPTDEAVLEAIKSTNWGRCVFRCDNDVVDHQVVNLQFEDGIIASFTMSAFTKGGREIRIMGTEGEIISGMERDTITYFDFKTRKTEELPIKDMLKGNTIVEGHGGGDAGIMNAFYDMLCGVDCGNLSDIEISVQNHMIAFAAEESRLTGKVVVVEDITSVK